MEKQIGDKTFAIYKVRSFLRQCNLELAVSSIKNVPKHEITRADCKILDLKRNEKGEMISKEFRDITDEDFDNLSAEEGDELYLEVLKYRFSDELKKAAELKKKVKIKKKKKVGSESKT